MEHFGLGICLKVWIDPAEKGIPLKMSYDWNLVPYWPTIGPSRHWCHEAQDETSKMGLQLHNFEPVLWAVGYHVEQKMIEVKTYMLWSFVLTSSHVFTLEHSYWWNYYFSYLTLQIIDFTYFTFSLYKTSMILFFTY